MEQAQEKEMTKCKVTTCHNDSLNDSSFCLEHFQEFDYWCAQTLKKGFYVTSDLIDLWVKQKELDILG